MRISEVLRNKGGDVVLVRPDSDVRELLAVLAEHRIGAALVSSDGSTVEGIVSERDIVRALAERGASVLSEEVGSICTVEVSTVAPDTQIDEIMRLMTTERIRHVPVLDGAELKGIVSIGDVVKHRIVELEGERAALSDYISTAR
jgi:CBS domain-containing protein